MSDYIEGGYILLSRKLVESEIWEKPPIYLKVWMYILTKAQHKPYKKLDRGELLVSIPELIEVCSYKVGYRTEKPTKSQIFNILEWLRRTDEGCMKDTMIDTTKTTRGMVAKVRNYNFYQDPANYEQNGEKTTKDTKVKRQANTINKNGKNGKNDKKKDVSPKQVYDEASDYYVLSQFMVDRIRINNKGFKQPNMQKWSDDFRKAVELDDRDKRDLSKVIRWVQQDEFEMSNVLSPSKLRSRFDNLIVKVNQDEKGDVTVGQRSFRPDSVDLGDEVF